VHSCEFHITDHLIGPLVGYEEPEVITSRRRKNTIEAFLKNVCDIKVAWVSVGAGGCRWVLVGTGGYVKRKNGKCMFGIRFLNEIKNAKIFTPKGYYQFLLNHMKQMREEVPRRAIQKTFDHHCRSAFHVDVRLEFDYKYGELSAGCGEINFFQIQPPLVDFGRDNIAVIVDLFMTK